MSKKTRTLLDRIRGVEKAMKHVYEILPYLKDCIIVTKILMEKGIVTREDMQTEYDKVTKV